MSKIKFWKILFLISFILNLFVAFSWFSKPQEVIRYENPGEVVVVDPINTLLSGKFKKNTSMLQTKCVGDNLKLLVTVLTILVTNLQSLKLRVLTLVSSTIIL